MARLRSELRPKCNGHSPPFFNQKDLVHIFTLHINTFIPLGKSLHSCISQLLHLRMLTKPTYHRLKCSLNDIIHTKFLAHGQCLLLLFGSCPEKKSKPRTRLQVSLEALSSHLKHNAHEVQSRLLTDQTTTLSQIKKHVSTAKLEHDS